MTESELRAILKEGETDRLEATVSIDSTDKFAEAVCAFANDLPNSRKPGYLIIGVDNALVIRGAKVDDQLLLSLGELKGRGTIQPLPSITVEKVATTEGHVAVVTVQPALLPPVRYNGRTCIRTGPRKGYATEHDERLLTEKRVAAARTFDAQPCLGSSQADLDLRLFQIEYLPNAIDAEVLKDNNRTPDQQLAGLRLLDLNHNCPTNAAMVLFGTDVRAWLAGAYIQFLRVRGASLSDPIAQDQEIVGDLLTVLRDLNSIVDANILSAPHSVGGFREELVSNFPRAAIRELAMNAIIHRDYASTAPTRITWFDDRIEIQSPGGLYGEASAQNFPRQTSYRNPVIAEAMKTLGYVNRFGRGVFVAREAMANNGNPEPQFQFDPGFVLAVLRSAE